MLQKTAILPMLLQRLNSGLCCWELIFGATLSPTFVSWNTSAFLFPCPPPQPVAAEQALEPSVAIPPPAPLGSLAAVSSHGSISGDQWAGMDVHQIYIEMCTGGLCFCSHVSWERVGKRAASTSPPLNPHSQEERHTSEVKPRLSFNSLS